MFLLVYEALKGVQNSLSDLSQEQQIQMQMLMDRMTQAETALSNLEKKLDDTAEAIVSNFK